MSYLFCHDDNSDFWDDDPWDAFLADDDERDPWPEPGDFFADDSTLDASRALIVGRREEHPSCCN